MQEIVSYLPPATGIKGRFWELDLSVVYYPLRQQLPDAQQQDA